MKVAIFSDAHNNQKRIGKILDFCRKEKINRLISCGDLASRETLDFLSANFSGFFWHVLGNMDRDFLSEKIDREIHQGNSVIFPQIGELELKGRRVAFTHFPKVAQELFQSKQYFAVFYGHTHQPWLVRQENCYLINPGNAAGERYPATFAVWEVEKDLFRLLPVD